MISLVKTTAAVAEDAIQNGGICARSAIQGATVVVKTAEAFVITECYNAIQENGITADSIGKARDFFETF